MIQDCADSGEFLSLIYIKNQCFKDCEKCTIFVVLAPNVWSDQVQGRSDGGHKGARASRMAKVMEGKCGIFRDPKKCHICGIFWGLELGG